MKILSWNVRKGEGIDVQNIVNILIQEINPDIFILIEYNPKIILPGYSPIKYGKNSKQKRNEYSDCGRAIMFIKESSSNLRLVEKYGIVDNKNIGLSVLEYKNFEFIIFHAHLVSKTKNATTQSGRIRRAWTEITKNFKVDYAILKNKNIIFIGDININPWDSVMYNIEIFNSTRYWQHIDTVVKPKGKIEQFMPKMYNPTWKLLVDKLSPVVNFPGSFYYNSGNDDECYVHALDQVLVSKGLVERKKYDEFRYISSVSGFSLLNKSGNPDETKYSDHLPLFITFEI